jgi:hypothetical protein
MVQSALLLLLVVLLLVPSHAGATTLYGLCKPKVLYAVVCCLLNVSGLIA